MRIHENGFSFFGGAQRGNAAAGQALTMSVASDWKLKKKEAVLYVIDPLRQMKGSLRFDAK